jgi:hypothetical protein
MVVFVKIDNFGRPGTIKRMVADVLQDTMFHCRTCLGKTVDSDQIAGGSGIQGLRREGYKMVKAKKFCDECEKETIWDKWTGRRGTITATNSANISDELKKRVYEYFNGHDPILDTSLTPVNALVDHRLPMKRWGAWPPPSDLKMSDNDLVSTFQLLRNSEGQNHNLLKSRACESCFKTDIRPPFLGFKYWYDGRGKAWPTDISKTGEEANEGCRGCGWYNVLEWKNEVNKKLGFGASK